MTVEGWEQLTAGIESVVTVIALAVGAIWAYFRFRRQREGYGRTDLTADLNFIGRNGDDWVVELVAQVDNKKGLVRHDIAELTFRTRYLLAGDPSTTGGPDVNGQLLFPHKGTSGRFFPKGWGESFVEAGGCNVYRFVTTIPAAARYVLVFERLDYKDDPASEFRTSQRVFAVPQTSPA